MSDVKVKCVTDIHAHACRLHNLASDVNMGPSRFKVKAARYYPPEPPSPYIRK